MAGDTVLADRRLHEAGLGNYYIVWDGEGLRLQYGRPQNIPVVQIAPYKMDDPPMVADFSRAITHFITSMAVIRSGLPGGGNTVLRAQAIGRELISSAGAAFTFDPTEGGIGRPPRTEEKRKYIYLHVKYSKTYLWL